MSIKLNFNEKLFALPFHKECFPNVNDIVIGKVTNIDKYGVRVHILNYNKDGYISTKEIIKGKLCRIESHITKGEIRPLKVIGVDEKKGYIDLSNKAMSYNSSEVELRTFEKYYRMILIMHTWLKTVYNLHYVKGIYVKNLSDSINAVTEFTRDVELKDKISTVPSFLALADMMLSSNDDCTALASAEAKTTSTNSTSTNSTPTKSDSAEVNSDPDSAEVNSDPDTESNKHIPYKIDDWCKLMDKSLWLTNTDEDLDDDTDAISNLYASFVDIKVNKKKIHDVFSQLFESIQNDTLGTDMIIDEDDFNILETIIQRMINYDINIKITLKLTCWSIGAMKKIKDIMDYITDIPTKFYDSKFTYSSVLINSPTYEFNIKSTNMSLMDELYNNTCPDISETGLGQILGEYLSAIPDIDFEISIERTEND